MKYYIGSDHAGFAVKGLVVEMLKERGHEVVDLGPESDARVDYPDYAEKVARAVVEDAGTHGILICGTGIGMSIAANKVDGIRAAHCHDYYTAQMARAHNDANILCFGERVSGPGVIESMIDAFTATEFEGGRHAGRVEKIMALQKSH
ncbi:ribose 5-phosphate isomerase B [Hydrogenimonas cancrithermarum]|uniref:Ribose 5-phosphate isomerase B n=1 Tax=Hydrogenimonas cancrithermarum TaxID=2993563 RepID=A0ABN6WXC7_9BACT|nr:ribose 5-phosphate isomerase B [Hydrogenimonas cancrithermarum]BDY13956.1 ribose 5-phosphate isomerase B [Hydrogenimonas cancrithermarum]